MLTSRKLIFVKQLERSVKTKTKMTRRAGAADGDAAAVAVRGARDGLPLEGAQVLPRPGELRSSAALIVLAEICKI